MQFIVFTRFSNQLKVIGKKYRLDTEKFVNSLLNMKTIEFYRTESGKCQVEEFLDSLTR